MKVKVSKPNIMLLLLIVIYILGQNVLYLVPVNNNYNLIAYVILALLAGYVIVLKKHFALEKNTFAFLMIAPVLLSMLAAVVEVISYNDASFVTSIYRQMQWWIYGLAYFVFQNVLKQSDKSYNKIVSSFIAIAAVQLVIGIVQYINSDTIFTYAPMTKRLGSIRFYFPIVLMVFAYFWALNCLFNKKNRLLSLIIMVAVLFEAIFVQQYRSTLIGILFSTVVGFMLWKNVSYKKIIIFVACGISVYIVYLNTPFLQQSIEYLLNGDTSLNVRHYLIDFILENAKTKWLFGAGWVSSPTAYKYASTPYRVHMNWGVFAFADGGIFSILYSYGLFGVLWVVALWYNILRRAWTLFVKQNNYLYLLFPLYQIATMYIDIHWYIHDQFFVMAMFCALLDYDTKKLRSGGKRRTEYGEKTEIVKAGGQLRRTRGKRTWRKNKNR